MMPWKSMGTPDTKVAALVAQVEVNCRLEGKPGTTNSR